MSYKVSICIPTYNTKFNIFKKCLNSALNQNYRNLEIIISENFSKNLNIQNHIKKINSKKIRYFRHTKMLKVIDHIEFVIRKAKGHYAMYLFDDDFISYNYVSSSIKILNNIDKKKRNEYFIIGKTVEIIKKKRSKPKHENFNYSNNIFLRISKYLNFPHDGLFCSIIPVKTLKKINFVKANSLWPHKKQMTVNLIHPFIFTLLINLKLLYNKRATYYFVNHIRRKPTKFVKILVDYFFGFFRIFKLNFYFLKILIYYRYYSFSFILIFFYLINSLRYLKKTFKKILTGNLY
jgi:glycosyltransferase involved in cell wall biosynthesis